MSFAKETMLSNAFSSQLGAGVSQLDGVMELKKWYVLIKSQISNKGKM